ncbi:MAG: Type 1 glutamine amidotransferase-like domain-containing protein [Candidatus Micrarchaeota archaeon]|nr:Type 1 glutamine amidotransferase-like domain-containing protein [Candidatus Micrarchaeota archaeon]
MKLLLTSAGITNKSLAKALKSLAKGKIRIAFIPTAANILHSKDNHDWLIKNYNECEKLGQVVIADISAVGKEVWLPRLKWANVIVMGGGNTKYLIQRVVKSGLSKELHRLLKGRVYVGISAGSIITSKTISSSSGFLWSKKPNHAPKGLGYVNFNIRPHFNSPDYPKARDRYLKAAAKRLKGSLYAIDDRTGIMYSNGRIRVISEGRWKRYAGSA